MAAAAQPSVARPWLRSAEKVRKKMIKIAAHQLEAAEEDLVYDPEHGSVYVKGSPSQKKSFFDLSFASFTAHNLPDGIEPGLEETTFFDPPNFTFPNSAHICQVEIDPRHRRNFTCKNISPWMMSAR